MDLGSGIHDVQCASSNCDDRVIDISLIRSSVCPSVCTLHWLSSSTMAVIKRFDGFAILVNCRAFILLHIVTNYLTPTVAIWVQLLSILCLTRLSHHL